MTFEKFATQLDWENQFIYAVLSNPRSKSAKTFDRVTFKPMSLKEETVIQMEGFTDNKAFHENLSIREAVQKMIAFMTVEFKQIQLFTASNDYQILVNRLGEAAIKKSPPTRTRIVHAHNRKKQYHLEEGQPIDFLIALGVMDEAGRVYKKKYDKFKQLNKFLEFIEATVSELDNLECIRILDFGCGKAYLTFALYHYLVKEKGKSVSIVGLDLKADVIAYCNEVARSLSYSDLVFKEGDIKDYVLEGQVDLVVTLHACDNATDEAIAKSVQWGAKVILSVPCCQHEFFKQLENPSQQAMLKHGILRDKLNSLVTDSYRGLALEALGYEVQMMEFIDMTHTPKNVLIRAFKKTIGPVCRSAADWQEVDAFKETWGLAETYLENSLKRKGILYTRTES